MFARARGLVGVALLTLVFAGSAHGATFTPETFGERDYTADPPNGTYCQPGAPEVCTLRDAFQAANDSSADDEIVLSTGRYELDPDIGGNLGVGFGSGHLLVRGDGARSSIIDGNGTENDSNRVLTVGPAGSAELRDLQVTGGHWGDGSGGVIIVFDSSAEGDGVLTLTRTWIFDNHNRDSDGGAIANQGKLTIVDSLLSANTAGRSGGAIANLDELTITNSTVSGNTANAEPEPFQATGGGGIWNPGSFHELPRGAGIDGSVPANAPFLAVDSSTITGNRAPTGNGGGVLTPEENCSFAARIGGNCEGPQSYALFHNTIVSDNTADGDDNCSGNFPAEDPDYGSSEGYNLENGASCLFTGTGDKQAPSGLAALANNGGGTDTHALNEGSAAIDGGDGGNCRPADQRGVSRPQRGGCDIGAFEREPGQQQEQVQQPVTPQGETCVDRRPPITVLRNAGLTVRDDRVILSGTSRDFGAPCPSGVQRVEVSMAKVSGTALNCRFVRSSNRFVITPFRNCRRPVLFIARGTTQWTFTFRVNLTRGKYRAQARGYDNARNKETPKKRRNIVYFEVE
jgi:hypothetical protein